MQRLLFSICSDEHAAVCRVSVFCYRYLLFVMIVHCRTVLRALVGAKKTSTTVTAAGVKSGSSGGESSNESDSSADDDLRIVENSSSDRPVISVSASQKMNDTGGSGSGLVASELNKLLMTGFTGRSGDSEATAAGAYETVLVILQDLSAMELEEAFDHVDIVHKSADTASVRVDGA